MKLRSIVKRAIQNYMSHSKLTQAQAAELCGVTQARVSELMRGKNNMFCLNTMVNVAAAAGLQIALNVVEIA